ncbi:hypothetical protein GQ55_5G185500 [Panicum hallii var. hallii]|uniref:Uncharacterized protein n=1 Tax=Panicum hallii var. hallii TaxID=1504633 RepID=A0A2T7DHQ7_9POAL|nr:hypothetical protein GQ55_5G185500 [Panicum hallii var. hallii]
MPPDPPNLPTRLRDTDAPPPTQSHPHPSELSGPAISRARPVGPSHVLPGSAQPRIRLAADPPRVALASTPRAWRLCLATSDAPAASGATGAAENTPRRSAWPAQAFFLRRRGAGPCKKAIRRAQRRRRARSRSLSLVPSAHTAIPLPPRPFPLRRAAPAAGFRGRAPRPSKRHPRAPPPVADQGVSADVTLRDLTAGPRAVRAFQLTPQQLGAGGSSSSPVATGEEEICFIFPHFLSSPFLSPDAPI